MRKEIEEENELARELEEENKKAILLLKIIHLKWLNKNQTKDTFRHVVIELDYSETVNQVIHRGLVHNMELKSAVRFDRTMQIQ